MLPHITHCLGTSRWFSALHLALEAHVVCPVYRQSEILHALNKGQANESHPVSEGKRARLMAARRNQHLLCAGFCSAWYVS